MNKVIEREHINNKMDVIVGDICANINNQSAINKRIEMVGFIPKDYGHLLYFEYAFIIATWTNKKVYVDLPLFDYIKLYFSYWKKRKYLKKVRKLKGKDTIDEILAHICEVHKINYTFYKKIFEEYCEVKKK